MTLKIYEISHPIIKTILSHRNLQFNEYHFKYIGLLLIYEIFRQNIITDKIYIKYIKQIKSLDVISKNKKYLILTNISETYDMISDIKILMPNIKVIHTDYQNKNSIKNSLQNLILDSKTSEVFIIEKVIKNDEIIKLIEYLNNEKKINNKNIKIGSIMINENTLKKIGCEYSELQIYTIKIIYNKR